MTSLGGLGAFPIFFVHSQVDDAGLTPLQFRLLGHLSRRAGVDGLIYSSAHNMASVLGLEVKTVRKALKELEGMDVINTREQTGRPSTRIINPVSQWKIDPTQKNTLPKKRVGLENGQGVYPENGDTPYPKNGHQRVSKEGYPHKGEAVAADDEVVEGVYRLYPRKVAARRKVLAANVMLLLAHRRWYFWKNAFGSATSTVTNPPALRIGCFCLGVFIVCSCCDC